MTHYRQTNGTFHKQLPTHHWLDRFNKVELRESNAELYGYENPELYKDEYKEWLISSGVWLQSINDSYVAAAEALVSETPPHERESWYKQEVEAHAYATDPEASTPYVDTLAATRGMNREFLFAKILEKVAAYELAHASLTGKRQALEDQLKALPADATYEQLKEIKW